MIFKKYFLISFIVALSVSALIGIFILLFWDFSNTEIRLLLTTLSIGGFSLSSLCCSTIYSRNELATFSVTGMCISIIGFVITAITIWGLIDFDDIWKTMTTFIVLSVAAAHISLLLSIKPKTDSIKYIMISTIVIISVVTLMLIKAVFKEMNEGDLFYRILGVFAILDVLGTIVTPIMNLATKRTS